MDIFECDFSQQRFRLDCHQWTSVLLIYLRYDISRQQKYRYCNLNLIRSLFVDFGDGVDLNLSDLRHHKDKVNSYPPSPRNVNPSLQANNGRNPHQYHL